jgi:RHS repeat-associated protein
MDARRPPSMPGNITRFTYDGLDRLLTTVYELTSDGTGGGTPAGSITLTKSWDDSSRLIAETDENGNTTSYAYDPLDRISSRTHADGTAHTFLFDVHDNLLALLDSNGSQTSTTYDDKDRPTSKSIFNGGGVCTDITSETYKYDGLSRLVHAEDNDSLVTRTHDSLSNVLTETQSIPFAPPAVTVTCSYDGVGNQLSCTYPSGRIVAKTYDELDRIKTITLDDAGGPAPIVTYSYFGPERVQRRDYGNGTRAEYTYNGIFTVPNGPGDFGFKQITRTKNTMIADGSVIDERTYTWDPVGSKTTRVDLRAGGPGLIHRYSHDSIARMNNAVVKNPAMVTLRTTAYALDGVGNRTSVTGAGTPNPGTYTLDMTPPKLDHQVNQYTTTPFDTRAYDTNGNLTNMSATVPPPPMPIRVITYDPRNKMCRNTNTTTGAFTTYRYDALGRRIEKTVTADGPPSTTRYVYDGLQEVEERDPFGGTIATNIYGSYIDEVLHRRPGTPGGGHYYHTDDLYNVMAVTDAAGTVAERYEYQDYGQPQFFTAAGGSLSATAVGNPFLFTGRRFDADTGLYWYRTRYYDSAAGRFTTRDTIGDWGDQVGLGNAYTYIGNNPMSRLDPMGQGWLKKLKKKIKKAGERLTNQIRRTQDDLKEAGRKLESGFRRDLRAIERNASHSLAKMESTTRHNLKTLDRGMRELESNSRHTLKKFDRGFRHFESHSRHSLKKFDRGFRNLERHTRHSLQKYERHHRMQLNNLPGAIEAWWNEGLPNALGEKLTSMKAFTRALGAITKAYMGVNPNESWGDYFKKSFFNGRILGPITGLRFGNTSSAINEALHHFLGTRRDSGIALAVSLYFGGDEVPDPETTQALLDEVMGKLSQ